MDKVKDFVSFERVLKISSNSMYMYVEYEVAYLFRFTS